MYNLLLAISTSIIFMSLLFNWEETVIYEATLPVKEVTTIKLKECKEIDSNSQTCFFNNVYEVNLGKYDLRVLEPVKPGDLFKVKEVEEKVYFQSNLIKSYSKLVIEKEND